MNHGWTSKIIISKFLFVFLVLKNLIFEPFIIFFCSLIGQNQWDCNHVSMVDLTVIYSFILFWGICFWFTLSYTFPILSTLHSLRIHFDTVEWLRIHVKCWHPILSLSNSNFLKLIITRACTLLGYKNRHFLTFVLFWFWLWSSCSLHDYI